MAHEIAKLLLEHADSFLERTEAVKTAMGLGMPINEIEQYMDWLEMIQSKLLDDEPTLPDDEQEENQQGNTD